MTGGGPRVGAGERKPKTPSVTPRDFNVAVSDKFGQRVYPETTNNRARRTLNCREQPHLGQGAGHRSRHQASGHTIHNESGRSQGLARKRRGTMTPEQLTAERHASKAGLAINDL